tara:strand:- start:828 stop:1220 length:393 start_codon:yes stop_codon:yes gene_type:complete
MSESKEADELGTLDHSLLYKRLVEGEEIEVWSDSSSPPPNFVVSVGGRELKDVRELHLVTTAHGNEIRIRVLDQHGKVAEWHEFFIPNPSFYLRAKVEDEKSSEKDTMGVEGFTEDQMREITETLHPLRG